MTFFRFIEKLQDSSEQHRKTVSFSVTLVISALIFVVWLTTFQLNSERIDNGEMYDKLSPLTSLKKMTSRFADDVKGGFSEIGDLFSETDDLVGIASSSDINTAAVNNSTGYELFEESFASTTIEDEILYGTSNYGQTRQVSDIDVIMATSNIDQTIEDTIEDDLL